METKLNAELWPAVPSELRGRAISQGDAGYQRVRSSYLKVGTPRLVFMAQREDEVAATIQYAAAVRAATGQRVPFSVRSGGHGMSGSSTNDGGIILDISAIKRIDVVDPAAGLVKVGAGAIWGDVAAALAPYDLALTSGNFGDTGVGGLATAGGVGYFARSQGLTIDRVRGARLITADGTAHWVDAESEPDLFWAVRGGGSQLGVVTELLFEVPRVNSPKADASIIRQTAQYVTGNLTGFVTAWGDWIRHAPRKLTSFLMLQRAGAGRAAITAVNVWFGTDTARAIPVLEDAMKLARLVDQSAHVVSYPQCVPTPRARHQGQQQILLRNVLVDHVNNELGAAVEQALTHPATVLAELRSLGGAVSDVPPDATAWAGRHQAALAAIWVRQHGWAREDEAFAPIRRLGTGAYGAYSADTRPSAAELAWPGGTGERLRTTAAAADPQGLFDQGLSLRRRRTRPDMSSKPRA